MHTYFHNRRMELFRHLPVVISGLLRDIRGNGSKLLDVGCWDGEFTVKYAQVLGTQPGEMHGLDFSTTVLETARQRGVQAHQVDLEVQTFPFDDNYFDVIVCNQVLEHLKQIYIPISEICRVLKEGGVFGNQCSESCGFP